MNPKYNFITGRKRNGNEPKYKVEFCDQIINFFDRKPYEIEEVISFNKYGQKLISYVEKPNETPRFIHFAMEIGVHRDTLNEWARSHPEFNRAYRLCRALLEAFITENALRGNFNSTAYKFAGMNITKLREKVEIKTNNTTRVTVDQPHARKIADQLKKDLNDQ